MSTKKTTIQFRKKNPIRKNSILVFFSVLKCILTFIYDAGNPNNSGKIGKNQKNKIFLSEILPSENKNTKFVNSVKFLPTKCFHPKVRPTKMSTSKMQRIGRMVIVFYKIFLFIKLFKVNRPLILKLINLWSERIVSSQH